ncbi:PspA/IM30 family protein [Pontixanthobacter sp. CEM42]|uniref:PspA/IM30 family protein n=1 Tax=Pontixanthobacter sp. CEM42 TaxID=2792077 RepID=UPI001ADF34EA|nr:PspA/IM30 family protein [Pontixanthobacter sp. CEM42]
MRIVVQVRELVSSNVTTMVEKASNPVKMLRLLRKEIEEADISLHGEIAKLTREKDRAAATAKKLADDAKSWSDKAKVAMDHDREDLARSALLAREDTKQQAEEQKVEAAKLGDDIADAESALEALKAKLDETNAQLREQEAHDAAGRSSGSSIAAKDSTTDKRMDRIANLERRVDHSLGDQPATAKSNASVEAEIASMQREASVDAELEKMRGGGKAKRKRKAS